MDILSQLQKTEIFSALGPLESGFVAEACEEIVWEAGGVIFEPGWASDCLWMILDGEVEIFGAQAESPLIANLIAGEVFGELEFLTGKPRNQRAVAVKGTTALRFPQKGLSWENLLNARPAVGARIVQDFLKVIAGRTRKANQLVKENSVLVQELRRQVYGDQLTGLFNKTYLEEALPGLLGPAPLALILFKPDNFKEINDRWGHEAGDATLVRMAAELGRLVPRLGGGSFAVRYMGNELGLVLPGCGREEAGKIARELNASFAQLDLSGAVGTSGVALSTSLGVALYPDHAQEALELIAMAHALPLIGRARGGQQVLFAGEGHE
ncbi:MAG: GGDEF domain-containing protein [Spirochaetales bacterium]|nr:GGDEF domain-containing protein [Spirochaetales bacterium]